MPTLTITDHILFDVAFDHGIDRNLSHLTAQAFAEFVCYRNAPIPADMQEVDLDDELGDFLHLADD